MCKNHSHNGGLISEIHSTAEAELEGLAASGGVRDDEGTVKARKALEAEPNGRDALIAMGDALAYQMRYKEALAFYGKAKELYPDDFEAQRKCAVRCLSVLDTKRARRALEECLSKTEDKADILYRLAVCEYCDGEYERARELFLQCYPYVENDGEMFVAVLYWDILCCVKTSESVDAALSRFDEGIAFGHHAGYMLTAKMFALNQTYDEEAEELDELNRCIYLYGLYAYRLYTGDAEGARRAFEETIKADLYFSSFAYLGAYSEWRRQLEAKKEKLTAFLKKQLRLAVAFSGGVDSAYLLYAAKRAGCDTCAYFVKSQFQPSFELADAKAIAVEVGACLKTIEADVLADKRIEENLLYRCYYCKSLMLKTVTDAAAADGFCTVADGTNADDDPKGRPGMRALKERGVISPLRECGITKFEIRRLARQAGLSCWNKPSYSCLATRVATGERITREVLDSIERAETVLFERGYTNFRVRYSKDIARLEIAKEQNERFEKERAEILNELAPLFEKVEKSDVLR